MTETNEVLQSIIIYQRLFRLLIDQPMMLRTTSSLRQRVTDLLILFKGRIQRIRTQRHRDEVYQTVNLFERTMMEIEELLDSISHSHYVNDNPPIRIEPEKI